MNRKMMKALTPPKDAIMSEMWSEKLFHISKNQVANVVHKKNQAIQTTELDMFRYKSMRL